MRAKPVEIRAVVGTLALVLTAAFGSPTSASEPLNTSTPAQTDDRATSESEPDDSSASASTQARASAAEEPLPTDPEELYQAGRAHLAQEPERAQAIGEALIARFPGTSHAVRGLSLIADSALHSPDPTAEKALLEGLATRLNAISPGDDGTLRSAINRLRVVLATRLVGLEITRARAGDLEGFDECSRLLRRALAEVEGDHDHDLTPELLYLDGQCSEASGRTGEAYALYRRIINVSPESRFTQLALEAALSIDRALARFVDAAELMEVYAERYPKAYNSPDFLQEALAIRIALGQAVEGRRDARLLETLYARKNPALAADIAWHAGVLATSEAERQAHAEAYLKRYGRVHGAVDRAVVAEATLAMLELSRSCPGGGMSGLCLDALPAPAKVSPKVSASSKSKRRCAEPTVAQPLPRVGKWSAAAALRLDRIDKLARMAERSHRLRLPEIDPQRSLEYRDAVEGSRLARLDLDLEAVLALTIPTGLRFSVDQSASPSQQREQQQIREASSRALSDYIRDKVARSSKLRGAYLQLRSQTRSVRVSLDATHRLALLPEHFGDQLLSAELPAEIAGEKEVAAYCDALGQQVKPMLEEARAAYADCAERAITLQSPTEATRACEAALARLDPRTWPPLLEYIGAPQPLIGELPPRSVGVQLDPPELVDPEATAASLSSPGAAHRENTDAVDENARRSR